MAYRVGDSLLTNADEVMYATRSECHFLSFYIERCHDGFLHRVLSEGTGERL
jgi:hypothetical protein